MATMSGGRLFKRYLPTTLEAGGHCGTVVPVVYVSCVVIPGAHLSSQDRRGKEAEGTQEPIAEEGKGC